jgi:uncharacterized protein YijF (DUF1287 family)
MSRRRKRIRTKYPRSTGKWPGVLGALVIIASFVVAVSYGYRRGLVLSLRPRLEVEQVLSGVDRNANGTDDSLDIVNGARAQVEARPVYKNAYYEGGYPPESEGVCTDLVWRALMAAGYDLKSEIDKDIALNVDLYPQVQGHPDPNIDFRRVPNISFFLKRTAISLTTEVIPWDAENLKQWQPGDIVIFGQHDDHIGIVSDRRMKNGVPLVIHHGSGYPCEDNALGYWRSDITGHYRIRLKSVTDD